MTTTPPTSHWTVSASTWTVGASALRSACFKMMRRNGMPLSRAASTYSELIAVITPARIIRTM